jgi:hypothetical protein
VSSYSTSGAVAQGNECSVELSVESKACDAGQCPYWREWSQWSSCSVTCGQGQHKRTRVCSVPNKCDHTDGGDSEVRFGVLLFELFHLSNFPGDLLRVRPVLCMGTMGVLDCMFCIVWSRC